MSHPLKKIWPFSGLISPASWPIRVDLPAPFGPMIACNSPADTSSEMPSEARTPPNRLVRSRICSIGSATVQARQNAVDAAAGIDHDEQQQRTDDDLPILRHPREPFLQHQERDRADQRAKQRTYSAEHNHHDEIAGACPMHHRRADEIRVIGE